MHGHGHGHRWDSGEERKRARHMWTVLSHANSLLDADYDNDNDVSPSSPASNSFHKDGRKISVGDCALFKPPQDSPPFIGIIRCLITCKEKSLKLGVNWLYRPAEVKLGKGILLEAAPNEIFYSFHKDEIPAASLLHPCKVAFLPKGVELPSGTCSFVCRRVYDITNKCLWWLTDQDYINERQEEVDQLLSKSRIEMHATVQPGGRSPKPMSGPTSTSQLKPGSDSVQNSASSFPSQAKGKKRERGEQGSEPVKRERYTRMDDGDSGHCRTESVWKSEIAKFTEKGGLVDSEGVEKLVQLMLPETNERKIDLTGRSMLAGVVAATDKLDCLNQFVQLRGLPVFDEWLQEVHKGKIGDASGHKDSDKSIEEFLLVLLRALDKLPINLQALQMCYIGKSVNHLRTHKNLEIQKKARSLVDTWKKRVEAEMDAKSGSNQAASWPSRGRIPEVPQGSNRHSGVSSEVAIKSSVAPVSASKTAPVKVGQGESMTKSASVSPGSMKVAAAPASVGNSLKEQMRNVGVTGALDSPLSTARDEKSSSSSQSHNNSQSYSSDHAKTGGFSGKDDARSSTAASMSVNKNASGSSRHRKSANGFSGPALSAGQRESGSSRSSSLHRNPGSEKLSQSGLTSDKAVDASMADGNSHKIIVKIPSRGRSPAQSASAGSIEDPLVMNSRASSPVLSEKHEQSDRSLKERNDAYRANVASDVNTESWQSNDFKEVLTGSDEGGGSPATVPVPESWQSNRSGNDPRKLPEVPKAASLSGNEHKSGKLHEASLSSMHALISCVTGGNPPLSVGDDGMKLLASVAAGEMSKSDVSPTHSPLRNSPVVEQACTCGDSIAKSSPVDDLTRNQNMSVDCVNDEHGKQGLVSGASLAKNLDDKIILTSEEQLTGKINGDLNVAAVDVQQTAEPCLESNVKSEERVLPASVAAPSLDAVENTPNSGGQDSLEKNVEGRLKADSLSDGKEKLCSIVADEKDNVSGAEAETKAVEGSTSYPSLENEGDEKKNVDEGLPVLADQKPPAVIHSEFERGSNGEMLSPDSGKDMVSENVEMKAEKADETDGGHHSIEKQKTVQESHAGSAMTDHKGEHLEENSEGHQVNEQQSGKPASRKASPAPVNGPEKQMSSRGSKLTCSQADEAEECTSASADPSLLAARGSDVEAKLEFDLNEGFNADDGKCGDSNNMRAPGCSSAVQLISPLPLAVSTVSSALPASITVAAAAKGPFMPPEDLLKNRVELGWKGSAATSAFRPAEPRKVSEVSGGTSNLFLSHTTAGKPSRPPLDIDLNVPDERILEDLASRSSALGAVSISDFSGKFNQPRDDLMGSAPVRSSGGLDLDLNRADDPTDMGSHMASNGRRPDIQHQPVKSSSVSVFNGEVSTRRDFDLNDGPAVEEASAEPSPFGLHTRTGAPSQPSVSGIRLNNTEIGNFSSWFAQGNSYPGVTIPSVLPDRGEQPFSIVAPGGPQRMLAPPTGGSPFGPDVYRMQSSPAVPFTSAPFPYPIFPYGNNFHLPSATFSGGSTNYVDSTSGGRLCFSQVLAPAGAVPPHYPRPYIVSLPDGNNSGGAESSRKWGRQGLDLNAVFLGADTDGRDEASTLASRQLSVASSQALAEEQSRMHQLTGGSILKRKEPEGGWESYKQSSWQ